MQDPRHYSTLSEKAFIDGLGTFATQVISVKLNRRDLLKNYIDSSWRRQNWESIDGFEAVKYARESLIKLIKKESKNA